MIPRPVKPKPAMNPWKIEVTGPHSGEIGEAILREDHGFAREEYTYEAGHRMEVAVHHIQDSQWHILTDLDSGHRIKMPPGKFRRLRRRADMKKPGRADRA